MQPLCCRNFSAAKILPNPKLKNKRKIFIGGFSKQHGFASHEFLVVRGNGMGISMEWPAHPSLVRGWGCVTVIHTLSLKAERAKGHKYSFCKWIVSNYKIHVQSKFLKASILKLLNSSITKFIGQ